VLKTQTVATGCGEDIPLSSIPATREPTDQRDPPKSENGGYEKRRGPTKYELKPEPLQARVD
jgi:hypothetical protein